MKKVRKERKRGKEEMILYQEIVEEVIWELPSYLINNKF